MITGFDALKAYILDHRDAGCVHVDWRPRNSRSDDVLHVADAYVTSLGFRPLHRAWTSLSYSEAVATLAHVLSHDLAYNVAAMRRETAIHLAEQFLSLFEVHTVTMLTNGNFGQSTDGSASWTPLTSATFDSGLVVFDAESIGIVWAEDED